MSAIKVNRLENTSTTDGGIDINTSGNVGIGTSSPDGQLTLPATASNTPALRLQSASSNTDVALSSYADANGTYAALGANYYLNSGGNGAAFDSSEFSAAILLDGRNSGSLQFLTDSTGVATERLRIDSSGNVGIGTTSPASPLTVNQSSANINFELHSSGSGRGTQIKTHNDHATFFHGLSGDTSGHYIYYTADANDHIFYTNNSERLRIDSSGRVGIGGTTVTDSNLLNIQGSSATSNIGLVFNDTNTSKIYGIQNGGSALKVFDYTTSTERLRIDSSGRVGIGTTSPQHSLSLLQGNALGWVSSAGNAKQKIEATGADGLDFYTGGTPTLKATIDSSGRLLVGTSSSPSASLGSISRIVAQGYVGSDTNGGVISLQKGETASTITANELIGVLSFNDSQGYSFARIDAFADANAGASDYPGRLVFSTTADGSSGPTERMRIDSSGRVGIGTSSPGGNLTVAATGDANFDIVADSDNNGTNQWSVINFRRNSTTGTPAARIYQREDNNALVFDNNGSERMRIDSSGRVGIGTSSPTHGLHVEHGTAVAKFHHTSSTNTTAMIFRHGRGLSGFQGKMVSMQRNDGTEVGNIIIGVASTAFNTSSDYRLKENVVDIADGITRVKQLSPRRFNFIADDTTTVDGFIAHEAQVIVPECVTGVKDEVDDDGNAVMQGIDQSKLVPLLTAALQEAIAKIETLEQRLSDAGIA